MMIKYIAMDVDGTLARVDKAIPPGIGERLRSMEDRGLMIILNSGKTASYLAGAARGMGLKKPFVIGENGGVVYNPLTNWEKRLGVIPERIVAELEVKIVKVFPDVWFQPNQTMITVFPQNLNQIRELHRCVMEITEIKDYDLKTITHIDAVEIMPKENNKGQALAVIKQEFGIKKEEMIAVGNTVIDLPMNGQVLELLIVGEGATGLGVKNFKRIEEALDYLERKIFAYA